MRRKFLPLLLGVICLSFLFGCEAKRSEEKQSASPGSTATGGGKGETYQIGIVYFGPDEGADAVMRGLMDGLRELGIEEGKNLEVKKAHANGEIASIPMLFQNFDSLGLDAIIPMSTPCLTAACASVKNTPVVFTYVYDPVAAGAGKSATDHLPFVTGTSSFPPVEDTVEIIQKLFPGVKTVGTLYNVAEANSVKVISVGRELFSKRGIKLEEVYINNTNEVVQAAQAVTQKDIQVLWVTGDNTALQAFDGIVKVASGARLPLVINDSEFVDRGALLAVGIGWYQTGRVSAKKLARVLKGENPAGIPFESYVEKKLTLNHAVAKNLGITFPEDLLKEASKQ